MMGPFIFVSIFLLSVTHLTGSVRGQASEAAQSCKPVEAKLANCERATEGLRSEVNACAQQKTSVQQQHDELVGDCKAATKKWEVALDEAKKQKAMAETNATSLESKLAVVDTSCKSVETEKVALAAKAEALSQQLKELEIKREQMNSEFKNLHDSCADITKKANESEIQASVQLSSVTDKWKSEVARNGELSNENAKNKAENELLTAKMSSIVANQAQVLERAKDLEDYQYLFSVAQAKRLVSGMYNLSRTSYRVAMDVAISNTPTEVKNFALQQWSTVHGSVSDMWMTHFTPNYVVMKRQLSSSDMATTTQSAFYDHVWPLMESHGVCSYPSKLWEKAADFKEDFTNVASELSGRLNTCIDDMIVSKVQTAAPQVGSMIPPSLLDRLALLLAWIFFTVIQKRLLMKVLCVSLCLAKSLAYGVVCVLTCGKCARRDVHKRRVKGLKPKPKHAVRKPEGKTESTKAPVDNSKVKNRAPTKK